MSLTIAAVLGLTFAAALVLTALLVPPVAQLCERRGWMALPGGRRRHTRPTPTIGGLAIYAGFTITLLMTWAFSTYGGIEVLRRSPYEALRLVLLLLGSTLIFVVMWVDDVVELRPLPKLVAQFGAALIAVGPFLWDHARYPDARGDLTEARGIILTAFNFPFVEQVDLYAISPWLAVGATLLWIAAMNNTINLVDGLDGLAAGVSFIASAVLALHAVRLGQYTIALLPLALAGACAGFLLFNFPPARIFMGDSGAHFLGYVLAVSAIIGGAKLATALLVLGVPILDMAWLFFSRTLSGRSFATSGRDHLHFRLLDLGFSQRQILLFYCTLSASFGLLGIVDVDPTIKLIALTLLGVIVVIVIVHVSRRVEAQHAPTPRPE